MVQTVTLLPSVTVGLGLLSLFGGVYGVINPRSWTAAFGIAEPAVSSSSPPSSSSSTSASAKDVHPFVQVAAVRNLVGGVTLLSFCLTGQTKAIGLFLLCGSLTAMADAWICAKNNAPKDKTYGHAFFSVMAGLMGATIYRGQP